MNMGYSTLTLRGTSCSREETTENILRVSKGQQICGAFHLVTVYEEKSIKDLSVEDLKTTMMAKVDGALKLYEFLYQNSKNAVLVLFSSVYSILPVKGLTAYSAANKFLECSSITAMLLKVITT